MNRQNGDDPSSHVFDRRVFSPALIFVFSLMFSIRQAGNANPALAMLTPSLRAAQEIRLEPDKPIERELSPRQSHEYQIPLLTGQLLRLTIEPQGADAALEITDSSGQKVSETNLTGVGGQERLSSLSAANGIHRLKVTSLPGGRAIGVYRLSMALQQQASPQEQRRITAERLLNEARLLAESPATAAQAVEKAEQALAFWRESGELDWETYSLNLLAAAWSVQAKHEKALALAEEALALARRRKDRVNEAQSLYHAGNALRLLSRVQPARESFEQALAISRELGDRWNEGRGLVQMGILWRLQGNQEKSLAHYEQALAINREVSDRAGEARTLNSLGIFYQQTEQREKAAEIYEQGLALSREMKDRAMEARVLNNLGILYTLTDRYEDALRVLEQVLPIQRANKDRAGEGRTLAAMVDPRMYLGAHQKAIDLSLQALEIQREFKDRRGEAVSLQSLGNVYLHLNQFEQAAEHYRQSLAIKREINDRIGAARSLMSVGNALGGAGKYEEALQAMNEVLGMNRELKDQRMEAHTLVGLGQLRQRTNRPAEAMEPYAKARALFRQLRDPSEETRALAFLGVAQNSLAQWAKAIESFEQGLALNRNVKHQDWEFLLLVGLAQAEAGRENNDRAREVFEQALALSESLRTRIVSQDLRASFFSAGHDAYAAYTSLLMRMHEQRPTEGFAALALQANERARGRNLLEQMAEHRLDIRQGVDPAQLNALGSLQRKLNASAMRRERLAEDARTAAQLAALDREIAALVREQEQLHARIRAQSPRYAALTQPQPLSALEIQNLLDADTVLLEYALDDKQSWLWLVTPATLDSYRLPPRAEIEAAAKEFHRLLAQPTTDAASENKLQGQAQRLSQMLLAPVAAQLGKKRLLIVATGALQYLPFAALPQPETGRKSDREIEGKRDGAIQPAKTNRAISPSLRRSVPSSLPHPVTPLIAEHEIINLPSASMLAVLRSEMTERRPATKTVAVLADPVFAPDDPRVKAASLASAPGPATTQSDSPTPLKQTLRDFRGQLERLFYSRDEAEAIHAAAPTGGGFKALDFQANRAAATNPDLGQYRIVHFATHGLLNAEHPELSGLVLSLVDEKGQPQEGFLRLHEIYNLKLNAELVVLSACQTALGKDIKGEGLIGLTRGFMYAGAPRVVASLWKVDDVATSELMKRFYRAMLQQKQRPAAALRAAQLEMMQRKRWQSPFYWAAFTLQGEWK